MKLNTQIGAGITVWIALTWALTSFLGVPKAKLLALRIIIMLLGALIGGAIAWYKRRGVAKTALPPGAAPPDTFNDFASVLDESERKLATSPQTANFRLNNLPVIMLTGPPGAAKTTVVLQSGLDPELLAGQVHQDGEIASTSIANIWLSSRAALVEAGPAIQSDISTWQMLAKRLQIGKFKSAMTRTPAAPRAAVVCFESDTFLTAGASEGTIETAKAIRSQLLQLAGSLGVNLPVYVLFTKLDRLAFFSDYVRTLDENEARQVLGVSIDAEPPKVGVYGERETTRLTDAFQDLTVSLSNKRTDLLSREGDPEAALSAYEFPREFRKLRTPLVKFLVELCRPSQLNSGPFLRGFYFCGVRPVVVEEELASAEVRPVRTARSQQASTPEATSMFSAYRAAAPEAPVSRSSSRNRRRVPQWVFLPHFFFEVVLADRSALAASSASSKTHFFRRLLLLSAAGLALVWGILTLLSFLNNRALVHEVQVASTAVTADSGSKVPSLDSLTKLDSLRQVLGRLRGYERTHPPLSLRWGLYTGSQLLPEARRLYFDRFHTLLFGGVQNGLLTTMTSWPAAPAADADYGYSYDTLKAYLETTSNHDKATMQFLPSVLQQHWVAGQTPDAQREALARRQFEFYTSELIDANPYSSTTDAGTVTKARHYLSLFAGVPRVYQSMLTGANQANKSIIFNQRFPGSAETIVNTREVPGAFSKDGFNFMDAAIKDPSKYVSGERWVLGDQAAAAVSSTPDLQKQIRAMYYADFIAAWRDYLKKSSVVKYQNIADAAKKLTTLSSPSSPLMALFWLASQNTAVPVPEVSKAFKPLYALMPPSNVDQYVGPSNMAYMQSLTTLQAAVDAASKLPPDQSQGAIDQINTAANTALTATHNTALGFGLDAEAHTEATIEKLLEDPIINATGFGPDPGPLNGAGADFCAKYRVLSAKYPFDPNSSVMATIDDVNGIFRPQSGSLWVFYQKISKFLPKQGTSYAPVPGQKPILTPRFVNFFNNAAHFSDAIYANGTSQDPKLTFALTPAFSSELQTVSLTIDGQTAAFHPGSPAQQYVWPGSGGVQMTAKAGADALYPTYAGLWGVFQFFAEADQPAPSPQWMLKSGRNNRPVTSPITGQPIVVHFNVDMLGGPPVFQKSYFRELGCASEVAR
ncbi:MAG TPA: ImcF-related family protein [Bryobacteraceae bacterium]|jgi:type VI secretion system protein ImpL|nr:ImcF-related family protein [Bryobacteraceae bacterium]